MEQKKGNVSNHWENGKIKKKYAIGIIRSTCSKHVNHLEINKYFEKFEEDEEFTTEKLLEIAKELIYDENGKLKKRTNKVYNPDGKMQDPNSAKKSWDYFRANDGAEILPDLKEEDHII